MTKPLICLMCVAFFVVELAVGLTEERSAATWSSHSEMEKLMYTNGYLQGFARGSIDGIISATSAIAEKEKKSVTSGGNTIDPARLARLKVEMRDQTGSGANKNMETVQIKDAITAFYSDFRNQGICWPEAFKFATMALNGDTPTEGELQAARKTDAQTGCK